MADRMSEPPQHRQKCAQKKELLKTAVPLCLFVSADSDYSMTLATTPEPTVRPTFADSEVEALLDGDGGG